MFGIGMPELLLILALALIVIGPQKLPEIAKALGRGFSEFKKATDDFKTTMREEVREKEIKENLLAGGKIHPPGAATPPAPEAAPYNPFTDLKEQEPDYHETITQASATQPDENAKAPKESPHG